MSVEVSGQSENPGLARLEDAGNGVMVLRLGSPSERVVTINEQRINSLEVLLGQLKTLKPKGVVIAGPSEEMFTAGADINLIKDVTDPAIGERLARRGQEVFGMLENLECRTVAAISGACVGGGCELVLACQYRLASDSPRTVIGLPETKLGIIPGFGGTQRLPRLVGLPAALDIILNGKTLKPKQALRVGLVDKIVKYEELTQLAIDLAAGSASIKAHSLGLKDKILTFTGFGRSIVAKKASQALLKQTKGFYQAPPAALDCTVYGLAQGMQTGLLREAKELGRMIATPESKALVNVFFLTEAAKALGKGAKNEVQQMYAMVIGAGTMGAGIAALFAKNEYNVILKDRTEADLERGVKIIQSELERSRSLSPADRSFALNRIERTTKDSPNIHSANLVIEAVFEEIGIKQAVLGEAAAQMPAQAIVATNTSSLSVSEIAKGIPNPERVVGIHFFNPVAKMPLIEIVMGNRTSERTIAVICALTTRLGKFPIVAKDVPGFLVNRILSPYLNESGYLLADGYSVSQIDEAALRFGMPMGPLRLLDEIGLDVAAHVADSIYQGYGERMKSIPLAQKLVAAGRKGKKNGAGFYDFQGKDATPHPRIRELLQLETPTTDGTEQDIIDRLTMSLLNEAVRALDEGVAGTPGREAANQIDLGSVMGFGFPPFRGGLLFYADKLGPRNVLSTLDGLHKKHGKRFEPWEGIRRRVQNGKSFYDKI